MAADDEILIAVAGPMTGQYAAFGREMQAGAEAAVAQLKINGRAAGTKLRLLIEDDECDRSRAIAIAERLVAKRVALVVGHYCASASMAAAPIYAAAGIIMISPGTTDPQFTNKRAGSSIFRLAWRDDRQEPAAGGAYIARHFSGKRVAILHDRTQAGIQLASATKQAINAAGLSEVMYLGFIAGERDYSRLARDLRAQRIDAVYLGAYPSEAVLIYAALRADGQTTTVIGSNLLANINADKPVSSQIDGMLVTTVPSTAGLANSAGQSSSGSPDRIHALVRSNSQAALEVWSQASTNDDGPRSSNSDVAITLQQRAFTTILGEVRFDSKGDAMVPYFKVHVWQGGELVPAP